MKMNEGIFRAPKWMRGFVDFEINTKDDIKGEPSKRQIKRTARHVNWLLLPIQNTENKEGKNLAAERIKKKIYV